jgi:chromosome segregation ATPase
MFRALTTFRFLPLLLLAALVFAPESAYARSRSRNSGAAAAAAKRKQQIASIQNQIAEAKKVLAMAEGQVQMSQSEVNAAVGKLQGIAGELGSMKTEHDAQLRALHELETKLLDGQPDGSPLDKADDDVERKLQALDEAFHEATGIPQHKEPATSAIRAAEMRTLTAEQKSLLEISGSYQVAQKELKDAVSHLESCKLDVLKGDSDWNRLHNEYVEASKKMQATKGSSQGSGLESLKAHQGLTKSKKLADAARNAIAQGEMQIRQLGGNPNAPATTTKKPAASTTTTK